MNTLPSLPTDIWVKILFPLHTEWSDFKKDPPKSRVLVDAFHKIFKKTDRPETITIGAPTRELTRAISGFRRIDTLRLTDGCSVEELQTIASSRYVDSLSTLYISCSAETPAEKRSLTQEKVKVLASLPALQRLALNSIETSGCDLFELKNLTEITAENVNPLAVLACCKKVTTLKKFASPELVVANLADCETLHQLEEITFEKGIRASTFGRIYVPATPVKKQEITKSILTVLVQMPKLRSLELHCTKDSIELREMLAFMQTLPELPLKRLMELKANSISILVALYGSNLMVEEYIWLLDVNRVGIKPLQDLFAGLLQDRAYGCVVSRSDGGDPDRLAKILAHIGPQIGIENVDAFFKDEKAKVQGGRYRALIPCLVKHADPNKTEGEPLPLFQAFMLKNAYIVERLLKAKANPNIIYQVNYDTSEKEGFYCPLHYLFANFDAFSDSIEMLQLLLFYGANPNIRDTKGSPLLHQVVAATALYPLKDNRRYFRAEPPSIRKIRSERNQSEARKELFDLLVLYGADVQAKDANGNTVVQVLLAHLRKAFGTTQLTDLIAEKSAYVLHLLRAGVIDRVHFTWLLHLAYQFEQTELITFLKDHGADIDLVQAAQDGFDKVLETFSEQDKVNEVQDKDGNSFLHLACRKDNPETVQVLLKKGADRQLKNIKGERPIDTAVANATRKNITLLA